MASGCSSQSRVEPSTSVNRNVTVPDGNSTMTPPGRPRPPQVEHSWIRPRVLRHLHEPGHREAEPCSRREKLDEGLTARERNGTSVSAECARAADGVRTMRQNFAAIGSRSSCDRLANHKRQGPE